MGTFKKVLVCIYNVLKGIVITIGGAIGAFTNIICAVVGMIAVILVIGTIVASVLYVKVKPEFDKARDIVYDRLANMDDNTFSMLSDTEIYDKDGTKIGLINAGHYVYTDIKDISSYIQNGYIAVEDRRFKEHAGVDFIGTLRAFVALVKHDGKITQGGSTITQQVIKNNLLTQEQTITRKMAEMMLAPFVEQRFGKDKIMEFYCNTNFYGNRCYGVGAASKYYFGKSSKDLDPWEAALLVGISNNPSKYDPVKHPEAAMEKRNRVLDTMAKEDYIDKSKVADYKSKVLGIVQETQEGTDENYQSSYAIHCAAIELMKDDGFDFKYTFKDKADYDKYREEYSDLYSEKSDLIRSGGFKIYTTLDSNIQNELQNHIDSGLSKFSEIQENGKFALQGAGVVVDNRTNEVVAIVGGRGTEDQFNRAYLSARQPGSTIKPLLDYGPAFDTGEYYPSKVIDDHKWEDGPSNSGSYYGNVTLREALNRSLNTVAWQLLQQIGVDRGLSYLGKMDFQNISYVDNGVEALSIGGFTNGLRVVDMAKGYSTLANKGVYDDRTCIKSIKHEKNGEMYKVKPKQTQVYNEDTAFMITDVLKGTFSDIGTGRGLGLGNMPAAGKTGTTNSNKDTWFCGYTKYYTTAIWVGYDTPRAMPGIYGATYAGKIWSKFMQELNKGLEPIDWEQPSTVYMGNYNPSTGDEVTEDTGHKDYFSSIGKVNALEVQRQREDRDHIDKAKAALGSFEAFNISTVEDTYTIGDKYNKVVGLASLINNDKERGEILKRASDKYNDLQKIANDSQWQDTIKEYERQKKESLAASKEAEESQAVEDRKQQEKNIAIAGVRSAIKSLTDMKYQDQAKFNGLSLNIQNKLKSCEGYDEYSQLTKEAGKAIEDYKNVPTYDVWYKGEQDRLAKEQQELEDKQRQEEEAKQKLEDQISNSKGPGNSNIGPGESSTRPGNDYGPGNSIGPGGR